MSFIGLNELILVGAAIVALILGPKKLPELARSFGEAKKEFKQSMKEADEVTDEVSVDAESEVDEVSEEVKDE